MTTLPPLFKRTSVGAVQCWRIRVEGPDPAEIVTEYGLLDGKIQTSRVAVRQGKNLGKANATTPVEQAIAEAKAKWTKQLDKGYRETLDAGVLAAAVAKKPMLAQSFDKYGHQVEYPCLVQPKLDGTRCIAVKEGPGVRLYSRQGKPIATLPHINAALVGLMWDGEVWDGELYRHGEPFQNLVSWIKRAQPDSTKVEYHVYDCIDSGSFANRFAEPSNRILDAGDGPIRLVDTTPAEGRDEVMCLHDEFVQDGYEGAMVRHGGCPYREGYRSRDLLKVKAFDEAEYRIVGAVEGKGKLEGCCVFVCETESGVRFECLPVGTDARRRAYWAGRGALVGRMLTVRYQGLTTSEDPVPRFPIGKAIRDYE